MEENRMKKNGLTFYFFVLMLLFYGCASSKVVMFSNATYPSREANATIDIYVTALPTKEYIELAKITCNDTDDKWNMQQIQTKAREIGADAIILVGKAGSYGVGIPIGYSAYVVSEEYGITAIAIKYK